MKLQTAAISVLLVALTVPAFAQENQSRALAREALVLMDEHPFEGEYLEQAAAKIKSAADRDPKEPYVYIAASRLAERVGYSSGDGFKLSSYDPAAVQTAATFAEKAVALGPQVSDAYSRLASVYVKLRRFPEAQQALYTAHQLEPDAFLPWYVQGAWYWYQGQGKKCDAALAGAEARAKTKWDHHMLLQMRADIAQMRGNTVEEEQALKDIIALEPGYAWSHGNYALFLMRTHRYEESVAEFEKAVALAPYGGATMNLERARELRDQERKRKKY